MENIEIFVKEYELLKSEVLERIKIAFSHLGYFGAVVAFAFPAADKIVTGQQKFAIYLAAAGALILLYISIINWCWVGRLAKHLQWLEDEVNSRSAGKEKILLWEKIANEISRWVLLPPRPYSSWKTQVKKDQK